MNSFDISALKGNRTLVWKNNLGVAEIDLEIGDKKVNLKVSPIQAALIYQFQVKEEWTAEQLSQEIKVTPTVIRRRMGFWVSQGLIRETAQVSYIYQKELWSAF